MSERITEYTVRDYSAVDQQITEIANRERVLTQKLQIANYRRLAILFAGCLLALGLFTILLAVAYKIAFQQKPKIIETVKVVEKIVEPPNIIINAPPGSLSGSSVSQSQGTQTLSGQAAQDVINDTNQRISDAGASPLASNAVYATLSWDNFNDLDLIVKEPNGNEIWFKKMQSNTKGRLDVDMNAGTRKTRTPVERVSWPSGSAPLGNYEVKIMYYAKDSRESSEGLTNYKLVVSDGKSTKAFKGSIKNNSTLKIKKTKHTFEVKP